MSSVASGFSSVAPTYCRRSCCPSSDTMCSAMGRGALAETMLTGTLTRPNDTVPLQMGRPLSSPGSSSDSSVSGTLPPAPLGTPAPPEAALEERRERRILGGLRLGSRELEHTARRLGLHQFQ